MLRLIFVLARSKSPGLGFCHPVAFLTFQDIDIRALFPSLADMEKDLPAFVAHRVRKLQTPRHLIEEIDSQPPPPPRLPAGKLKHGAIRCVSPGIPVSVLA